MINSGNFAFLPLSAETEVIDEQKQEKIQFPPPPAIVLLFLARGPNYGASLLLEMQDEMPYFLGDSAMVYRTLRDLETQQCVTTEWQTSESSAPKRIYYLTEKGWQRLQEYREDIARRMASFHFFFDFLAEVEKVRPRKPD